MDYRVYLQDFMPRCDFSEEAIQSLLKDYDTIHQHPECGAQFDSFVALFDRDLLAQYRETLDALSRLAERVNVPYQAVHMLFLLCLSRRTKELYEARGISDEIYWMSMKDMTWKLRECHRFDGVWGTNTAPWFERFFRLTRFALGRLQFEPCISTQYYEKNGLVLEPGGLVLNVHIPSCGPLDPDACMDAFRQAEAFFGDLFGERPVVVHCCSWLLYKEHERILPENSNIRKFMKFFDIVDGRTNSGHDLWRIFYCKETDDLTKLPQQTGLQRAYVKMLQEGTPTGVGIGIFFLKDGKIL